MRSREENGVPARPEGMTHYYFNQELAKHRYATLMREASSHRLAKDARPEKPSARPRQLTWLLRSFVRRPAVA